MSTLVPTQLCAQVLSCGGEGRLLCWPMPGPPQWAAAAAAEGHNSPTLPVPLSSMGEYRVRSPFWEPHL